MIESKERKYAKHLMDVIEEEIAILKEKIQKLQKQRRSFSDLYYDGSKFKCPLGKTNKDAICPECEDVLPETIEGSNGISRTLSFLFPYNMSKELAEKQSHLRKGCRQWKKKETSVACGCGGTESCICGYRYDFCSRLSDEGKCDFCGRELKIEMSGIAVAMPDILKTFSMKNLFDEER